MDIKSVNSPINTFSRSYSNATSVDTNQATQTKTATITDRLEISKEARDLRSKEVTPAEFSKIQDKISSGYYNSNETISKIADSIFNDINK